MTEDHVNDTNFIVTVNQFQKSGSGAEGVDLVHDHRTIYVRKATRSRVLYWYYRIFVYPGKDLIAIFTLEPMNQNTKRHCNHHHKCQIAKAMNKKKYGLLPEKVGEVVKINRVNIN